MEKQVEGMSELALAMRQYRDANGLTRKQFAGRIGMKYMTYCPIEYGYHRPGKKALSKIAKGLGLRYDEALSMLGKKEDKEKEGI